MSLLEKAAGGKKSKDSLSQARMSLMTRAMAASSEEREKPRPEATPLVYNRFVAVEELDDLSARIAALPPLCDSILLAWSLVSTRLPFDALALFLPQGDFLSLAAQSGFPSGTNDAIPVSLAPPSQKNGELLGKESRALFAPVLGVSLGMDLRATSMWSDVGLAGIWIYHDTSFEASPKELQTQLITLFANAAAALPASFMALPVAEPYTVIREKMLKFHYAAAFRFDLARLSSEIKSLRGIEPNALRSSFLSACERILSQGGVALAYGAASVACALGSSSPLDPELALFQFAKTLKRTLPFLAAEAFPEGSVAAFDPSSDRAVEELSRFLSA